MSSPTYGRRVARGDTSFRRALTLVFMSLVLPGSGHLVMGRRRLGRGILRVFMVLIALAVLFGLIALVKHSWALWITTEVGFGGRWLLLLRWGVIILGLAWAAVVVHAYVLANPPSISHDRRMIATVVTFAVAAVILVPTYWLSDLAQSQRQLLSSTFVPGTADLGDRVNILLLGGDAGDDRVGLRPDSINLASVDVKTGRAVLFGLPRNMEGALFPEDSPLHDEFPDGFRCADDKCMINGVYTWANDHPDLFPAGLTDTERGTQAMREVVSATLGVDVPYYALVDLSGFENIVNALGGITINVQSRVPIGGNADDPSAPVEGYIEPGLQVLNGHEALWYSRSRTGASDYARMVRQRCVMGAILREASPTTVITKYKELASAAESTISTNIPQGVVPALVQLALRAKSQPLSSVQFVPPLIPNTAHPDFDEIHDIVQQAIHDSMSAPAAAPSTSAPTGDGGETGGGSTGTATPSGDPAAPVNVDEVCSYS